MRYRHCIFDLYGTLVDIRTDEDAPGLWAAMADYYRAQGCDYDAAGLRTAYRRLVRELEKERAPFRRKAHEAHPEIQIELVFQRLFQEKGAAAELPQAVQAGRHFRELSTEYIRLYNGVRELLTVLRERGRSIWLLSNAQAIFTRWELDRLQLTDCFDGIYLSSDYGVKKPDRRFFDILLQEQSIPPERAVMIGNDGVCDIQGGRTAGLATIYIRSNLSPKEQFPQADYVLRQVDLRKLQGILTDTIP